MTLSEHEAGSSDVMTATMTSVRGRVRHHHYVTGRSLARYSRPAHTHTAATIRLWNHRYLGFYNASCVMLQLGNTTYLQQFDNVRTFLWLKSTSPKKECCVVKKYWRYCICCVKQISVERFKIKNIHTPHPSNIPSKTTKNSSDAGVFCRLDFQVYIFCVFVKHIWKYKDISQWHCFLDVDGFHARF